MPEVLAALIGLIGSFFVAKSSSPATSSNSVGNITGHGNSVNQTNNNIDNSISNSVYNVGSSDDPDDSETVAVVVLAVIAGLAVFGLLVWLLASAGGMISSVMVGVAFFIFGTSAINALFLAKNSKWSLGSLILVVLSGLVLVLTFRVAGEVRASLVPAMQVIFEESPGDGVAISEDGGAWFAADALVKFQTVGFVLEALTLIVVGALVVKFAIRHRNGVAPRWYSMKVSKDGADSAIWIILILVLVVVTWVLFLQDPAKFFDGMLDRIVNFIDSILN